MFSSADEGFATIHGFSAIRRWADAPPQTLARMLNSRRFVPSPSHEVNYLALSGGGSGGAFSAGVLNGWTVAGNRPEFDIVSGVSTGALIAPFAFLGPDYDGVVASLYTEEVASSVAEPQNLLRIASSGSLADPSALRRLIERYATADLLAKVSAQHRLGRRLLVITTNLDAQRPVMWDMGAIASSGRSDALALFRNVLVASASVPAVYPPVMIEVDMENRRVQEMHVDGGATGQVFVVPEMLKPKRSYIAGLRPSRIHIWVIVNNTLPPEFAVVESGTLSIAARSLSTLIKSQTKEQISAAGEEARRLGMDFNVAYIRTSVPYNPAKPFQSSYTDTIFSIGERGARDGDLWQKSLSAWMEPASPGTNDIKQAADQSIGRSSLGQPSN
jgi:predicted acylesterase/phospholipase RssA